MKELEGINIETMKLKVVELTKPFIDIVITDIAESKKDLAHIRKEAKGIDTILKTRKDELMPVIKKIDAVRKEFKMLFASADANLKTQLDNLEVERKQNVIHYIFDKLREKTDLSTDGITLPPSLLNASTTQKAISDFVKNTVLNLEREEENRIKGIESIKNHLKMMNETFDLKVPLEIEKFVSNFVADDLSAILERITKEAKERSILEKELERKRIEEKEQKPKKEEILNEIFDSPEWKEIEKTKLTLINISDEKLKDLQNFLDFSEIEYKIGE